MLFIKEYPKFNVICLVFRGPISKIEVSTGTTNVGSVGLAQDKKRIIWNIGMLQKWTI